MSDSSADDAHPRELGSILGALRRRAAPARSPIWPGGPIERPEPRTPVAQDPALGYLHAHWVLPDQPPAATGRGWRRALRQVVGRVIFSTLSEYLGEERELLSRVVQMAESLARRVDALEAELTEVAERTSAQLAELVAYVPVLTDAGAPDVGVPEPDREQHDGEAPG